MHIVYAVTTCSDKTYARLFGDKPKKPSFQAQKYHCLLIDGLSKGAEVDVIANPPVNRDVLDKPFLFLEEEQAHGARFRYLPGIRNRLLKGLWIGFGTFFGVLKTARKDSAVVVDVLHRVTSLSALLAAKLKGIPCVGIITDMPDHLSGSKLSKWVSNSVIRYCTCYVLMIESMNTYIGNKTKPNIVLEGHADISMEKKIPSLERKHKPRVCLYAGGVTRQYGLHNLVEAFRLADLGDTQLHIYGPGDCVELVKEASKEDPRIFYGGMLLSSEVVEKEMEATLLINPPPTDSPFLQHSFPSKTMEYMASGSPVLTTILPGMPREYHPHVYLIPDETPAGIAKELKAVLSQTDEELFQKGMEGRRFVLEEKNNVVQAKKILDMLEAMKKGT